MLALKFFDEVCPILLRRLVKRALLVREMGACEGLCSLGYAFLESFRLSTRGRASRSSLDIETALPGGFPLFIIRRPGVLARDISRDDKGGPIPVPIVLAVTVGVRSVRRRLECTLVWLGVAPAWNDWVMRSSPVGVQ